MQGCRELEPSHIACETVKWYCRYGKQLGGKGKYDNTP